MGIRDEELERIKKYCNGLGIKVTFFTVKRKPHANAAEWSNNPPEIEVFSYNHDSKTEIILSLLHEIAHHMYWIHNNKPEIPNAYALEQERKSKRDKPIPKSERKKIYDYEANGIAYMKTIAIELNLKIALWRVELAQDFDLWMYEYYYETGNFPLRKQVRVKRKELLNKYRGTK